MSTGNVFAVLGLGEAGSLIARDLVRAGRTVRGWDPDLHGDLSEIPIAESHRAAVEGADVVISVNWAIVAEDVARETVPFLAPGKIFADHNTAGPALKARLAEIIEPSGAAFVDVAMMAPVPPLGIKVPMFLAGSGARAYAELLRPLGTPIGFIGTRPGEANARKLTRSVYYKGFAAAILEALAAARAVGVEDWLRSDIIKSFVEADETTLTRMVEGTHKHAKRRAHEMEDASAMLEELGIPPLIARATAESFTRLAEKGADLVPAG
jgi:3-hydroxyisobutyrate dehydrogenase-like beta-hydroxyacid dehydrogenase